jgi:hypothetical protein
MPDTPTTYTPPPTEPAIESLPTGGGSWQRLPDGSLQRLGGTEPASDAQPEA